MAVTKKGKNDSSLAQQAQAKEVEETPNKKIEKGSDVKSLAIAALVMTVLAVPSGWFLGQQFGGSGAQNVSALEQQSNAKNNNKDKTKQTEQLSDNPQIANLPSLVTTLREPENARLRMEIALIIKQNESLLPEQIAEISNDFIALARQMTLVQIKGATGLMNLRDDFLERAQLRSEGKVSALLISNLVIE